MKNKKYIQVITLIFLFLFVFSKIVYGIDFTDRNKNIESPKGVLFISPGCFACKDAIKYLDKNNINYLIYSVDTNNNFDLMYKYSNFFNVKEGKKGVIPVFFTKDNYYHGDEIKSLKNEDLEVFNGIKDIELNKGNFDEDNKKIEDKLKKTPILAIIIAGFLDGFNPCAFSMLLFFISFVFSNNKKPNDVLKAGLPFIFATFLTYLLIGLGLLNIGISLQSANNILKIIYGLTIVISLIIFVFNFNDYINIKKGNMNMKNQLPKKVQHFIHNIIRKYSNKKLIIISSFLLGFLVSILEFFCTGQVYLPTIAYVLTLNSSNLYAKILLIIYNLSFILPLSITLFLVYKEATISKISMKFVNNIKYVKLLTSIFFLLISIYMIKQYILL